VRNSIEVAGLGKRYTVGGRAGAMLLTEVIANRMRGRGAAKGADFWALQDVSFSVGDGELVGIIGRNGAGKTTLLRILARITAPTAGVARVRGRLSALLDVGTGFHDELTGRENVFLSGAILGMSRNDVRARFDQITDFSGVERFLDTPLKRYSAGMRLRLAFAVAAHLEPDVLVIDEALAVGDAEFQRRCIGRMEDLQRSGRTVVFVSHELGAIGRLCDRTPVARSGSRRLRRAHARDAAAVLRRRRPDRRGSRGTGDRSAPTRGLDERVDHGRGRRADH
jgi:ABC-2 type transport system ATP-binding protein/lipopolysaccharide transport system ATP-binding protein